MCHIYNRGSAFLKTILRCIRSTQFNELVDNPLLLRPAVQKWWLPSCTMMLFGTKWSHSINFPHVQWRFAQSWVRFVTDDVFNCIRYLNTWTYISMIRTAWNDRSHLWKTCLGGGGGLFAPCPIHPAVGNKAVLASLLGISCIFVRQAKYSSSSRFPYILHLLYDWKKVECINFSPNTHEGCIENISKYLGNFIRNLSCFFSFFWPHFASLNELNLWCSFMQRLAFIKIVIHHHQKSITWKDAKWPVGNDHHNCTAFANCSNWSPPFIYFRQSWCQSEIQHCQWELLIVLIFTPLNSFFFFWRGRGGGGGGGDLGLLDKQKASHTYLITLGMG